MAKFFEGLLNLIYPPLCIVCGKNLIAGEDHLCSDCLYALPRIQCHSAKQNPADERLAGKLPFEKAAAAFYYQKESHLQVLMESIKYKSNQQLALFLGNYAATLLQKQDFCEQIDLIVPVPLHKNKLRWRGYNQSECLARGLSQRLNLPVDTISLQRLAENPTQTTRGIWERRQNVEGIFNVVNHHGLTGKHVLLVDDVLTSGSTMEACGHALLKVEGLRLSFFALALA